MWKFSTDYYLHAIRSFCCNLQIKCELHQHLSTCKNPSSTAHLLIQSLQDRYHLFVDMLWVKSQSQGLLILETQQPCTSRVCFWKYFVCSANIVRPSLTRRVTRKCRKCSGHDVFSGTEGYATSWCYLIYLSVINVSHAIALIGFDVAKEHSTALTHHYWIRFMGEDKIWRVNGTLDFTMTMGPW